MPNGDLTRRALEKGRETGRSGNSIRVYIVSHSRVYYEALKAALDRDDDIAVVGASTFSEVAFLGISSTDPDLVLLDCAPPQRVVQPHMFAEIPDCPKLVALGIAGDDEHILACAESGFSGYVPCNASLDDLRRVMREVVKGQFVCSPGTTAALVRKISQLSRAGAPPPTIMTARLTMRQREIAALLGQGLTNKEIGRRLSIRSTTVRNHVHAIFQTLEVRCRAEAVAILHLNGYQAGMSSGGLTQDGPPSVARAFGHAGPAAETAAVRLDGRPLKSDGRPKPSLVAPRSAAKTA